jgi:membrane protease YdiL (CAAX protease family)
MGRTWRRQIALRRPSLAHVALALAALPAFMFLGQGSYNLVGQFVPSMGDLLERIGVHGVSIQKAVAELQQLDWWFAVLVIGVGPGIGEELWCRGFLGRGMVGNYGIVLGVLLTSFWFGFIHMDPPQGIMAMLMGIGLHYTYLTTRSLWVPMLLHFGNNSLEIVAPKVPWLDAVLDTQARGPHLVYPAAVLLMGTVGLALYRSRARLAGADGGPPTWRPDYPGVELPPPGSDTVVTRRGPGALCWVFVLVAALLFATAVACALQLPLPPRD